MQENKYHARSCVYDGLKFDSIKERNRYCELRLMQKAGRISDLRCQVEFELIPEQREPDRIGKRGGIKKGFCIERKVSYVADFVYNNTETGATVVEDVKGKRTKDYIIKRKLMLFRHGIRVKEI